MIYDKQILKILSEVGEGGIGVSALVKHVYNMNVSFFAQPDLQEVCVYVRQYLQRNSRSAQALIEHAERRGYYRLNTRNSADARQLMLDFRDDVLPDGEKTESEKPHQDFSLSLFDDL